MATYDVLTTWNLGQAPQTIIVNASGEILTAGRYGVTNGTNQNTFTTATIPQNKSAAAVACGNSFYGAVSTDGSVYLWGNVPTSLSGTTFKASPEQFTLANGKVGKSIALGTENAYVVCTDGTIQAMGANSMGQLGNNENDYFFTSSFIDISMNKQVVTVRSGADNVLAICSDGSVQAWGNWGAGQLGVTDATGFGKVRTPTPVDISGNTVIDVTIGATSSALVLSNGSVMVSGYGLFRTYSFIPFALANNKTVKMVSCGTEHLVFLCTDNTLQVFGNNQYGQLGNGTTTRVSGTPVTISLANGATPLAIKCGSYHSVAICTDGSVQTWGFNNMGQLALGNTSTYTTPQIAYAYANITTSGGGGGGGGGGGPIPCFPTGTLIRTPTGDKPVETLSTGDYVLTADNRPVPIRLYSFHVSKATELNAPYVVPANSLGPRQPARTLHLSPHHAFQIRPGVWQMPLLAAEHSAAITQYGLGEPVTYYHVECPNYFRDNLVADGVVCESFGSNQTKGLKSLYRFAPAFGGYTRISNPVHTPFKTR